MEKTKLHIDVEGLLNKVAFFEKENHDLKQHLENICRSYDESIEQTNKILNSMKGQELQRLDNENRVLN